MIRGGNTQSAIAGSTLTQPLEIAILDASGAALQGVTVSWSVASGGGTIQPTSSPTDSRGRAQTVWTLGTVAEAQTVTASVAGLPPVTFTATAKAGPPAGLTISNRHVVLGALEDTLRLKAASVDSFGNAAAATIAWRSLDTTIATVTTTGLARARRPGATTIVATVNDHSDSAAVQVTQLLASVSVQLGRDSAVVLDSVSLKGIARDSNGYAIPSQSMQWTLAGASARLDSSGYIHTLARGVVAITATTGGVAASRELVVLPFFDTITAAVGSGAGAGRFTCGITAAHVAYCWGDNAAGQLGNGSTTNRLVPAAVVGGLSFTALSAGASHVCAITTSGAACWGDNASGQLGTNSTQRSARPAFVIGAQSYELAGAGEDATCGMSSPSGPTCWGSNSLGALGIGKSTVVWRGTPMPVAGGLSYMQIGMGRDRGCGLSVDSLAYCWGDGSSGALGIPADSSGVPVAVQGALHFASLAIGSRHACGLTASGLAYCWGDNSDGQLGAGVDPSVTPFSATPLSVAAPVPLVAISAGSHHTCALASDGTAFCWGANDSGQLGDGTTTPRSSPVMVGGNLSFSGITAGTTHTCGVATTGLAYCWGANDVGQLGDGTTTPHLLPGAVARPR